MVRTRMLRSLGSIALLLALLPGAAAATEPSEVAEDAPGRVLDVVRGLAESGAAAGATAASGAAAGAGAAAEGTASVLDVLLSAASAAADAAADAARAAGHLLAAGGSAALTLLSAGGALLAAAARSGLSLLASALSALGALLSRGAGWMAENPRQALYATAAAGGATAAGGLLYWLKRLGAFAPLAGLYTRLTGGQILDNEARARVFEEVRAHPGVHPSALKEKLGLGWGTVVYHLDRLEETGLVTSRVGAGRKCYFVNGSGIPAEEQRATTLLKHPSARAIADLVRAHPGLTQKALAEQAGMSPALVSWHVRRLAAAGVLAQERTGRGVVLRLGPGTEPALAAR